MKKLLGIIVLGLLLSGNAYANDDIKIGMSAYEVKKILKAKGKKIYLYFPLKKTFKKQYAHGRNSLGEKVTYAFEFEGKKKLKLLGTKKTQEKYRLVKIFQSSLEPYDYYLNFSNIHIKDKTKLINQKNKIEKNLNKLAVENKRKSEELTQQKAIDQYLSGRKLDPVEGIWMFLETGTLQVTYKNNNEYICKTINSQNLRSGSEFCNVRGSNNSYSGSMLVSDGSRLNVTMSVFGNNRTDFLSGPKGSFSAQTKRLWPEDIDDHNAKYKTENDIKNEEKELALIVNDAKKTCGILGFEEGSEKFADCTLKLYTQKIDEMIADKQARNQQLILNQQANTTTQSSSGTNTTIIYDPVRDRQNQIDRGMKMLGGKCTLGVDC